MEKNECFQSAQKSFSGTWGVRLKRSIVIVITCAVRSKPKPLSNLDFDLKRENEGEARGDAPFRLRVKIDLFKKPL